MLRVWRDSSSSSEAGAGSYDDAGVVLQGLRKSFSGAVVLRDVSFVIPPGTVLALLGVNGAGKTTVVRILATLLTPDSGRALIEGCDVRSDPGGVRRAIGLAGQHTALDGYLTGEEAIKLVAALRGLSKTEGRREAAYLLDRFGIGSCAQQQIRTFSGGMRRRLDLALAIVGSPPVLLLDEPSGGLDPHGRRTLWSLVREEARRGAAVLLTTQLLDEAENLADHVVVLDRGRVLISGSPAKVKAEVSPAVTISFVVPLTEVERVLRIFPHARTAMTEVGEARRIEISMKTADEAVSSIARLDSLGVEVLFLSVAEASLETVFLAMTSYAADGESVR